MEGPRIDFKAARERMVASLRRHVKDQRVLDAFASVPRERFVPADLQQHAYDDRALPIGAEQTISQPLIVALMLEALSLRAEDKALEVGTGSGYQAALMSLLVREVITVERIPRLADSAAARLRELGYANVRVYLAGEALGWPEEAPYDAIVVAAGAPEPPPSLVDQLAMNGRMIVPAGSRDLQQLVRVIKSERGVSLERLGECRFVPLIARREGWSDRQASHNGARASF
jgi:protein-L-isoaspartate(D-aspartate) O-methyltransferase